MGGQAARIPLLAVKVIARVEKLEHVDSTELCQRHQRRALHIHADAPLCLAQCHLPAGFAVEGVRRPHFAFGEVHARFAQNRLERPAVLRIRRNFVRRRRVLEARAFVAHGGGRDDDAAVANLLIQHAAVAEYDEPLCAQRVQLFQHRHAGRRADHCQRKRQRCPLPQTAVNGVFRVRVAELGKHAHIRRHIQHPLERDVRKAADDRLRQIRHRRKEHIGVDDCLARRIKIRQKHGDSLLPPFALYHSRFCGKRQQEGQDSFVTGGSNPRRPQTAADTCRRVHSCRDFRRCARCDPSCPARGRPGW